MSVKLDPAALDCPVPEKFGPHGGKQFRSPRYFFCGCDAGYCEAHAIARPLGPFFEPGAPVRRCKRHKGGKSHLTGEPG